jgi:citrate lyase subunit beta/citryl-CoA lyase
MNRPLRSVLYVPASNERAVDKARSLPCDAVILDLEDAVAPEAKAAARVTAVAALQAGFGERTAVLRVNAPGTPWAEADLAAAIEAGPDAVLLPKVDTADDVLAYDAALGAAAYNTGLWAMVETPLAVLNLATIAAAAPSTRLSTLVLGLNDLASALMARLASGRAPFTTVLSATVIAARAHGLLALDAVFTDLDDEAGFDEECCQGRDFGFDGKTLIHPKQIPTANRLFSPSEEELAWASAVVAAFDDPLNAGRGVVRVEGRMAEGLHLEQARRMLGLPTA